MTAGLTRRFTLAGGLATLAAARAGAAALPPVPPTDIAAGRDVADRMTVEVAIDGKGPFRFLVDTGADRTVVADDVAALFGPPAPEPLVVEGIAATITARAVNLKNLTCGPVEMERLRAPVLPRAALGADGYLGLDAIDGRRVSFDFRNHVLSVEAAHSLWGADFEGFDAARVTARGDGGKLIATDCSVDGVRAYAFIDTGAEITVGNSRLFERLKAEVDKSYLPGADVVITGVTGGRALGKVVDLNQVRLGGIDFTDGAIAICDLPIFDVWGMTEHPAMLIGMNFLKHTQSLSIDYRRKEIYIRIAEAMVASRV